MCMCKCMLFYIIMTGVFFLLFNQNFKSFFKLFYLFIFFCSLNYFIAVVLLVSYVYDYYESCLFFFFFVSYFLNINYESWVLFVGTMWDFFFEIFIMAYGSSMWLQIFLLDCNKCLGALRAFCLLKKLFFFKI